MKRALILHGTGGDHTSNWFPWLQQELEKQGYQVWTPDLPGANRPNTKRYIKFLLTENDWEFNEESIIIGHSSGAVAILGLLQALPAETKVGTCYLVGSFSHVLADEPDWEVLKGLFEEPFDFEKIKAQAQKLLFIHSQDDPYCPLEQAEFLAEKTDGELIVKKDQKHFSIGTAGEEYKQFPFLLDLILKGQSAD